MSLPDRLLPHRLRTRLLAANLSLALLVLAVFGVLTSSVLAERQAGEQADHSGRVITAAHRLEKDILDLETGSRGFLVARDESFLAPWRRARRALGRHARSLVALSGRHGQRARAEKLARLAQAYRTSWSEHIVALARRSPRAAVTRLRQGEGKRRVDEVRLNFNTLVAVEEGLRRARRERAD